MDQKDKESTYLAAVSSIERLISQVKQYKSTSLKSQIVALYTADDDNPLRFSGKIGILQLDYERGIQCHFLRMYNIDTLQLLLEVQLYYGFGENYRKCGNKQTLYIFDYFADGIIGFEFRNSQEAEIMAAKIKSVSPKNQQFRQLMKDRIQKQIQQKKQSSFLGKIKKKFKSIVTTEELQEESVVLKVNKQKSIKMNFETGQFDFEDIPPEWQQIFAEAGIMKQDLKNKQVAKLVFEQTILHQAKKQVQENPHDVTAEHLVMIKQEIKEDDNETMADTVASEKVGNSQSFLPPPPILNLPPPTLTSNPRVSTNRNDLMAEIRNNKLKLKPVKNTEKGFELDASSMNKEQRKDLAEHIRMKLQMRKLALNRRKASNSQDDQEDN